MNERTFNGVAVTYKCSFKHLLTNFSVIYAPLSSLCVAHSWRIRFSLLFENPKNVTFYVF